MLKTSEICHYHGILRNCQSDARILAARVNCYGPTTYSARVPTCRLRTTADAVYVTACLHYRAQGEVGRVAEDGLRVGARDGGRAHGCRRGERGGVRRGGGREQSRLRRWRSATRWPGRGRCSRPSGGGAPAGCAAFEREVTAQLADLRRDLSGLATSVRRIETTLVRLGQQPKHPAD